jgi:hypothetical protein
MELIIQELNRIKEPPCKRLILQGENTIMSPAVFEGIKALKGGRFGSIIIRDFRIHDDLMRNPEMISKLFQFIDNKFSFILNLRTIKYLEEFLNLKTHDKHIVLDYPIYES